MTSDPFRRPATGVMPLPEWSPDDFGGRPYGLEPLVLPAQPPPPGPLDLPERGLVREVSCSRRLGTADPTAVFWFRWITGHQVSFVLWQLLAHAMDETGDPDRRNQRLRCAACFVRGYSAMLLYTASCPRTIYHQIIRPSMALIHPGFSGTWARDYRLVRDILRGHWPGPEDADSRSLMEQQRLNELIHDGIAVKLVPSAPSLLQTFTANGRLRRSDTLELLYDSYFLTRRDQVPYGLIVGQLLRRLDAIVCDLVANGLYPDFASSESEKDPRLREPAILTFERDMAQFLPELADHAVTLSRRRT